MIASPARHLRSYSAILGSVPKLSVAYRAWFWMEMLVQTLALVIFVYFWRAVYADRSSLGGLSLRETLNYIMLAQILLQLVQSYLVFQFGRMLVEGSFAVEMLRPLDLQARYYVEDFGFRVVQLVQKLPLAIFAWLVFDLRLPADPKVWGAFLVALFLGHAVMFCFVWIFACLAFYTTESWGLAMVQQAVAAFFSGALIPLDLMPAWLAKLALALPFAQAIYVPVSILSGITPPADVPGLWLTQALWLVGLFFASRLVFRVTLRKVTIHGG